MVIGYLREKMYNCISKYGLESKQTYEASTCLDKEIAEYYKLHPMKYYYEKSIDGLKEYINKYNKKPSIKEWNKYARDNNYLSSESMGYIGNVKFND